MKNAIVKGLVGIAVVLATAGGVYVGGILPVLLKGNFAGGGGFEGIIGWLYFLFLLWAWASVVGGLGAGLWRRCGYASEVAMLFALGAALLVFGPSLLMLLCGNRFWESSYDVAGRVVALGSLSLVPSQVAFWGFAGVMRIGWERRRGG